MARATYSIPGVDALFVGMLDEGQRFIFVQDPVLPLLTAIGHGTKNDLRDLQA